MESYFVFFLFFFLFFCFFMWSMARVKFWKNKSIKRSNVLEE